MSVNLGGRVAVKNPLSLILNLWSAELGTKARMLDKIDVIERVVVEKSPPSDSVHGQMIICGSTAASDSDLNHKLPVQFGG